MTIVAHAYPFVIGVDAHARSHALAVVACPTGELLDETQFPATVAGLQRAVSWVARRTGGDLAVLWVIEGVGTYGARLARAANDAGYAVAEAGRMSARANRGVGKSDPLDARRIAQSVLAVDVAMLRRPRADDGVRAAVRVLIASRDHISRAGHRRRRPGRVVASRPGPLRSRIRQPRRGEPDPSLLRQYRAPSHQPWRRPTTEPRPSHGCRDSHTDGSTHPRLRREANCRGTNSTRDPPLPHWGSIGDAARYWA